MWRTGSWPFIRSRVEDSGIQRFKGNKRPVFRKHPSDLKSSPLNASLLRQMDAVVVMNHSRIDYHWVAKQSSLVVDTHNATKGLRAYRKKIVKA